MGEFCRMQLYALFMFRRRLHVGNFFVVLALPDFFVMLFRNSLGMGQRAQLGKMLAPGFLFFRRQPNTMIGLRFRFGRNGRRMMVMFRSGGGRISGRKNGQGDQSR